MKKSNNINNPENFITGSFEVNKLDIKYFNALYSKITNPMPEIYAYPLL